MKIVDVTVETFHYRSGIVRDSDGHGHPGPEHDARQSITTIITDEGLKGYAIGNLTKGVLDGIVKPLLVGQSHHYREHLWQLLKERQRLNLSTLSDFGIYRNKIHVTICKEHLLLRAARP